VTNSTFNQSQDIHGNLKSIYRFST